MMALMTGSRDGRQLLWSDEFDGPAGSPPDPRCWGFELGDGSVYGNPGWGNGELQLYTDAPANAAHDGRSNLVLTARRTDDAYSSARLVSKGRMEVCYGRIEVRAQLPRGAGLWPAVWAWASISRSVPGRPVVRSTSSNTSGGSPGARSERSTAPVCGRGRLLRQRLGRRRPRGRVPPVCGGVDGEPPRMEPRWPRLSLGDAGNGARAVDVRSPLLPADQPRRRRAAGRSGLSRDVVPARAACRLSARVCRTRIAAVAQSRGRRKLLPSRCEQSSLPRLCVS
jgi:hypothetical protein